MKKTRNVTAMRGLLKWLIKTVLVAGLLTFSGNVSEYRSYSAEPIKTELNEAKRVSSKSAVYFKKINAGFNSVLLHPSSPFENYSLCLIHQKNRVTVKLKCLSEDRPSHDQDKGFLVYQPSYRSDDFDMSQPAG